MNINEEGSSMNDVRPYVGMWKICMKILINKFLNLENNSNSFFTILNGYSFHLR
jgi:hypothetical protein